MRRLPLRKRLFIVVVFYLVLAATSAAAFSFSPMTVSISPSGANAIMTYKVTNESDQQTAVSIKVATRTIDASGVEKNEPADKLFLVFPSRVVLKGNSSQNVKVQYRGNPSLASELAFRVIAEQLPVDFTKSATSGVSILLTYVAALYVTPKNVSAKLTFAQAVGAQKDGKAGLQVTVKNEGTKHALLSNPIIRISESSGASPREFSGEAAAGIDGQNILALSERTFFVPWEAAVMGATYEGVFDAELE
jgi:fimbrial chaperone protein